MALRQTQRAPVTGLCGGPVNTPVWMGEIGDAEWGRMLGKIRQEVPEDPLSCWLWMGATDRKGYGRVFILGKNRLAHRAAYTFFRGEIPTGLTLDHTCRQRACVNPYHLDPCPFEENTRRGDNWNRGKTHCIRGHPFDLYGWVSPTTGKRSCRECARLSMRRRRAVV